MHPTHFRALDTRAFDPSRAFNHLSTGRQSPHCSSKRPKAGDTALRKMCRCSGHSPAQTARQDSGLLNAALRAEKAPGTAGACAANGAWEDNCCQVCGGAYTRLHAPKFEPGAGPRKRGDSVVVWRDSSSGKFPERPLRRGQFPDKRTCKRPEEVARGGLWRVVEGRVLSLVLGVGSLQICPSRSGSSWLISVSYHNTKSSSPVETEASGSWHCGLRAWHLNHGASHSPG